MRFNIDHCGSHLPCEDGDYVLYSDYKKLEDKAVSLVTKKIEKIKQLERIITTLKVSPGTINEELQKAFDKEQSKNESLRQQLENAKAGKL